MMRAPPIPSHKKPTAARWLFSAVVVLAPASSAARTWDIEAAHARVLEVGRYADLAESAVARERARTRAMSPRENPFVGVQREQAFALVPAGGAAVGDGAADSYVWGGYTFDLSFRRGVFEDAGERRAAAAELIEAQRRREVLFAFDERFFEALADAERLAAVEAWIARLRELARRTELREERGDVSRYDVLRVQRELATAERHHAELSLSLAASRTELAKWLGDDDGALVLDGTLQPGPPPPLAEPARALAALALDEEAKALALEEDVSARWYLPPLTATAGAKVTEDYQGVSPTAAGAGYYVTFEIPVPALERGDDQRAALSAERRALELEADLEARRVAQHVAAAHAVWVEALLRLDAHESGTTERTAELVRIAQAAWAGGELSLLALLEAERAVLDDAMTAIFLRHAARRAEITYRALGVEAVR